MVNYQYIIRMQLTGLDMQADDYFVFVTKAADFQEDPLPTPSGNVILSVWMANWNSF